MSAQTTRIKVKTKLQAKAESGETIVEIDTGDMEKRILENLKGENKKFMEQYIKENHERMETSKGRGVVEVFEPDRKTKILEELHKGADVNNHTLNEQWTICVPKYAIHEVAGHLRDYVWVTDVVKGKEGDIVNIPTVQDVEFEHPAVMGAFAGVAGLINTIVTTLHESGTYYDAFYGDIERIDSNMLDELNRVFAHAAVRAEDFDLVALLCTATTGQFESYGGFTHTNLQGRSHVGTTGAAGSLGLDQIVDALVCLKTRGKDVHPGELVLYCNPLQYGNLLDQIVGSQPILMARPDYVQKGLIEDFLGVKIIVGGKRAFSEITQVAGTTYDCAFLFRPKRALALAPKRDILIETDKLIMTRQLRIAASHTYGVAQVDMTECVVIKVGGPAATSISPHA